MRGMWLFGMCAMLLALTAACELGGEQPAEVRDTVNAAAVPDAGSLYGYYINDYWVNIKLESEPILWR